MSSNRAPLVEALLNYLQENRVPFHIPAHKGGQGTLPRWREMLGTGSFLFDLTEVEGLDDLHAPTGIIKEAEELAAALMGSRFARFLVNGVSGGLYASIMSVCGPGEKIIVPRHAHRSIFSAVALAGAEPIYLTPEIHPKLGMPLGINIWQLEELLKTTNNIRAMVVVHPTYHGIASDIDYLISLAKNRQIQIIADEAHGAHFKFNKEFPVPAITCGADIVCQGWHKTMGSFTQSALMLINDQTIQATAYLKLFQTTSPSYLLMGSLDAARLYWAECGETLAAGLLDLARDFRRKIVNIKGITCLDRELLTSYGMSLDPTKLVISADDLGLNGFQLAQVLRTKYRIEPEMAEYGGVTLMLTIGDTQETISYLLTVLQDLSQGNFLLQPARSYPSCTLPVPQIVLLPGEALRRQKKPVPLRYAAGEVAGEFICPYPPGIPLIVPGEKITNEVLDMVTEIIAWGGKVQGPMDPTLGTLQVIAT